MNEMDKNRFIEFVRETKLNITEENGEEVSIDGVIERFEENEEFEKDREISINQLIAQIESRDTEIGEVLERINKAFEEQKIEVKELKTEVQKLKDIIKHLI